MNFSIKYCYQKMKQLYANSKYLTCSESQILA